MVEQSSQHASDPAVSERGIITSQGSGVELPAEIRPGVDRKATLWTPVILGSSKLPLHVAKTIKSYRLHEFLHRVEEVKLPPDVVGGILLNMPSAGITNYLRDKITLEHVPAPTKLYQMLSEFTDGFRSRSSKALPPRFYDVEASQIFRALSPRRQQMIRDGMQDIARARSDPQA